MPKAGTSEPETAEAPPSLERRLGTARRAAQEKRQALDGLNAQLQTAVAEQRYGDAEQIKGQIPDASHAWGAAEAEVRALTGVLEDLAREQQQRDAAEQAERRRQAATGHLNVAAERERELLDDLSAVRAELVAGLEAIAETMRRGMQIEGAVRQARMQIAQARVDLGEATGVPGHIAAPNPISSLIERSTTLTAIYRGQALTG